MKIKDLAQHDFLGFPQLGRDSINPVALELVSGPHALKKADSILTYMKQIDIKGRNLTREEASAELATFPDNWKLQYFDIKTPPTFQSSSSCSKWVPGWWDEEKFGTWHDLRLVRCRIPPSYRSATSRQNYHWVVIGFGGEPSNRLNLRPPMIESISSDASAAQHLMEL